MFPLNSLRFIPSWQIICFFFISFYTRTWFFAIYIIFSFSLLNFKTSFYSFLISSFIRPFFLSVPIQKRLFLIFQFSFLQWLRRIGGGGGEGERWWEQGLKILATISKYLDALALDQVRMVKRSLDVMEGLGERERDIVCWEREREKSMREREKEWNITKRGGSMGRC